MSGSKHGSAHTRWRTLGWLAVGVACTTLLATSDAAWNGQQDVALGDKISAGFVGDSAGVVHRYRFYAPATTKLKAKLSTPKGSALTPGWRIVDDLGVDVDLGSADNGDTIKNFVFDEGGFYEMLVNAENGEGRYDVATKAKFPGKIKEKNVDGEISFDAVAGTLMTAKLKGGPSFTEMLSPMGPVVLDADTTSLKKFVLQHSGTYTLAWEGVAKKVIIKLKAPPSRNWFFDTVEPPRGIATLARDEWLGSGHADSMAEAFRHWDEDGEISTSCAKCHSSLGYQDYLGADGTPSNLAVPGGGTTNPAPLGTTVDCDACHNTETPGLDTVTFPSGEVITDLGPEARCMQCHQGRESSVSLEEHITAAAVADDDTESTSLRFRNIHYFAAGASLYGNAAKGAYQYDGKIYNNQFPHVSTIDACQECHNPHTLEIRYETCAECHAGVADHDDLADIRAIGSLLDYDGDGDTDEGLDNELQTLGETLYDAIQQYATASGNPIIYDSHSYPYYFNDTNGNGVSDPGEAIFPNQYNHWTARLLRAAYNYQYWQKDPGAFAHNGKYMIEILYDTLESLNAHASVTVAGFDTFVRNDSGHFDNTSEAFRHWDEDGDVRSSCAKCHSPGGFEFSVQFGIDPVTNFPFGDGFACEQCHLADDFDNPDPARYYVAEVTFPSGVTIENDPENPDDSFLCMTCHSGRTSKAQVDETIAGDPDGQGLRFQNVHYLAAGPSLYGADAGVGYEYDGKTYPGHFMHAGGATNTCAFCHLEDHTFLPQLTASCQTCHPEAGGDLKAIRRDRPTDYDGDGNTTENLEDELHTMGDRLFDAMVDYASKNGLPPLVYVSHYPYMVDDTGARFPFDGPLLKASFNYQMWKKDPGTWAHNTDYMASLLYDSIEDLQNATGAALDQDYLTTPSTLNRP